MSVPNNKKLYNKVKAEIFKKYPKNSAYRSGLLVSSYKKKGGTYSGDKKKAPLKRWFDEEWKNQRGGTGYKKKGDIYRPTKRINAKTPATFKELTKKEKEKAMKEKKEKGRVKKFKKK